MPSRETFKEVTLDKKNLGGAPETRDATEGEAVVFLISQPRSGSTLLQRMLGQSSQIHTLPEPWLMLPLAYLRHPHQTRVDFNSEFAARAVEEFLAHIKEGAGTFDGGIQRLGAALYRQALHGTEASLFLDKTPRYYHIIPDLILLYPRARFVFLVRNPVAVLASRLEEVGQEWLGLVTEDGMHDLLTAPGAIASGMSAAKNRGVTLRYEDLIENPRLSLKRLSDFLDIEFTPSMLDLPGAEDFAGATVGDKKSIHRHAGAVADYIQNWREQLSTPIARQIARSYIEDLGEDTMTALGYSYGETVDDLGEGSRDKGRRLWNLIAGSRETWRVWDPLRFNILLGYADRGLFGAISGALHAYRRRQLRRLRTWLIPQGSLAQVDPEHASQPPA